MKAYDLVDRGFLKQVIEIFSSVKEWIQWLDKCISAPMFLVLMNGKMYEFFNSKRGIRKGDPIPPFLIIIMVESLGRGIKKIREEGKWYEIKIAEEVIPITHQ